MISGTATRRNAACPSLMTAGPILLSQATAFTVTMTQTQTATPPRDAVWGEASAQLFCGCTGSCSAGPGA